MRTLRRHRFGEQARVVYCQLGNKNVATRGSATLYVLLMVAVIVAVDLLFFRNRSWFWQRLAANIGIVLVFVAFFFRFFKHP